jgi:hypothetical protein
MSTDLRTSKPLLLFFGVIVALLFFHAMFPPNPPQRDLSAAATEDCIGEPLSVPYEYTGNVVEPWSCQPQCADKKQRYLVYTNGLATQCEMLPGCNDYGEDRGQTCRIPGAASVPGSVGGSLRSS